MKKTIKHILVANGLLWIFSCNVLSAEGWQTGILGSSNGRYVLGQLNQLARDQYLLDTQTGQLWRLSVFDEAKNVALFPVPYIPADRTSIIVSLPDFTYLPSPPEGEQVIKKSKKK